MSDVGTKFAKGRFPKVTLSIRCHLSGCFASGAPGPPDSWKWCLLNTGGTSIDIPSVISPTLGRGEDPKRAVPGTLSGPID